MDVKRFNKGCFFSETTLVYLDESGEFCHPISIKLRKTKNGIYCILKVVYGKYNLLGGGCGSLESSLAKEASIREALDNVGIEISPKSYSVPGFSSEYEGKIAKAIANALELNPKHWTLVSSSEA